MQLIFWISALLLAYTFAGYPLLMRLLARLRPKPPASGEGDDRPKVSVIVAAYNAESRIADRIANILACDYPADRLEILITSDGSDDDTAKVAKEQGDAVRVLDFKERRGKPACVNDAVAAATGEIVVLADARQDFDPDAIRALVAPFADPSVGAVSGELSISSSASGVGEGIGGYWKMERALRRDEARSGSAIGCTGAIYAIRRELYRAIPADTLIDDVVIPMQIARRGDRVLFRTEARAYDPQPLDPDQESRRKRRTIGGNFQMLCRHLVWCLPWGHPLWWRLISHKYLRLVAPVLLVACFVTNGVLAWQSPIYALGFALQIAFYALAVIGMAAGERAPRLFSLPSAFVFLNAMTVVGFFYYLGSGRRTGW